VWTLSGTDADATRNLVLATDSLDRETMDTYEVTIVVNDGAQDSSNHVVTVTVTDVNDNNPTLTSDGAVLIAENATGGSDTGLTLTRADADITENTFSWTLTAVDGLGGDASHRWALTGGEQDATRNIELVDLPTDYWLLDYETTTKHTVTVTVADAGGLSGTEVVTITVTDVDEDPVVTIDLTPTGALAGTIAENATAGTAVLGIAMSAVDPQGELSEPLIWTLDAGTAVEFEPLELSADPGTYVISPKADPSEDYWLLDYETKDTFAVTVTVTDAQGHYGTATTTIDILDIDEDPVIAVTMFPEDLVNGRIAENVTVDFVHEVQAITVRAVDGTFDLGTAGGAATIVAQSDGASGMKAALEALPDVSEVDVSFSEWAGGPVEEGTQYRTWLVTFLDPVGDIDPMTVSSTSLGSNAVVRTVQDGYGPLDGANSAAAAQAEQLIRVHTVSGFVFEEQSLVTTAASGQLDLTFLGHSATIDCQNDNGTVVQSKLEALDSIHSVDVMFVETADSRTWAITFLDPVGDVAELAISNADSELEAAVTTVQEGHAPLEGVVTGLEMTATDPQAVWSLPLSWTLDATSLETFQLLELDASPGTYVLRVVPGVRLDYELQPSYDVTVNVTDYQGHTGSHTLTVDVVDVSGAMARAQDTPPVGASVAIQYALGEDMSETGTIEQAWDVIPSIVVANSADVAEQAITMTFDVQFTEPVEAWFGLNAEEFGLFVMRDDGTYVHLLEEEPAATFTVNSGPDIGAPSDTLQVTVVLPSSYLGSPTLIVELQPLIDFAFKPAVKTHDLFEFSIKRRGCNLQEATNYQPEATMSAGNCDFAPLPLDTGDSTELILHTTEGEDAVTFDLPVGTLDAAESVGVSLVLEEQDPQDPQLATPAADDQIVAPVVDISFSGGSPTFLGTATLKLRVTQPNGRRLDARGRVLTALYKHTSADPWTVIPDAKFNEAMGTVEFGVNHLTIFTVISSPRVTPPNHYGGGCDHGCSGHGRCMGQAQCSCYANWEGPTCALRKCPHAPAWGIDHPGNPHYYAECSNRGICNREKGMCECAEGYTGAACERNTCPNACSGNGKCRLLSETSGSNLQAWGGDNVQVCVCDGGFSGPDCSQRLCPVGDDPTTLCDPVSPTHHVQRISFKTNMVPASASNIVGDEASLGWEDAYGTMSHSQRMTDLWSPTAGADSIRQALLNLPNFAIPDVTVQPVTASSDAEREYLVTFTSPRTPADVNLLTCPDTMGCNHAGCAPRIAQPHHATVAVSYCLGTTCGGGGDPVVSVSSDSVVFPPTQPVVDGEWDLEVQLTFSRAASGEYTYRASFAGAGVPVESDTFSGFRGFVHPSMASEPVNIGFGLRITMDVAPGGVACDDETYKVDIKYSAVHCTVAQETGTTSKTEAAECGNRGLCNRLIGECECFDGYTGWACGTPTTLGDDEEEEELLDLFEVDPDAVTAQAQPQSTAATSSVEATQRAAAAAAAAAARPESAAAQRQTRRSAALERAAARRAQRSAAATTRSVIPDPSEAATQPSDQMADGAMQSSSDTSGPAPRTRPRRSARERMQRARRRG
jgi:hypothetical protein